MNSDVPADPRLERLLAETPISRAPDQLRADIRSATGHKRQRPPWLTNLKEPPMRYRSQLVVGSPTLRLAAVIAVTAVLTLALAGAVIAGASLLPSPAPELTEAIVPTWVTGNVALAPSCTGPDSEQDGAVRHDWNMECDPQTWTSSDPRLTGEVSARWNEDVYQTDAGVISVSTGAYYLRNDGGGWACSANSLLKGVGMDGEMVTGDTLRCVGEGGYEGLSALLVALPEPSDPFLGLIFSGDFPPLPEPPAAE